MPAQNQTPEAISNEVAGRWTQYRNPWVTDLKWPTTSLEAHRFLDNAYWHLRNRDSSFDTLDGRRVINTAMYAVGEEL